MRKTKSKITIALTAVYCAVVGAGIFWQNFETNGAELAANILEADSTSENTPTIKRIANANDIPNRETESNTSAPQMGMSPETRAKIKDGAAEINESLEDLREIMGEAEWCMNNKSECASEKITLPPKLQEMANKLKEAEEYSKYMQAIPMLVQSKIDAVQSEIRAEIARVKFLAKNEVPLADDTLGAIDKLDKKVSDTKKTAEAATKQLGDACGSDCEVEDKDTGDSSNEVALRNIPTPKNAEQNNSSTTMIARNSGENKIVASTRRRNNSPLSASILSVNSVATPAPTNSTTTRKVAIVTTSSPPVGSKYAAILTKLEKLESNLDDIGGGLDELAKKTSEKIEEKNQKLKDDFAKKQKANKKELADAKKAVDDFEPPEPKDENEPTAIGFWNLDANGNKIYSEYGDVIPIRPVSSGENYQPDNSFVLPTWNYNEPTPVVETEV